MSIIYLIEMSAILSSLEISVRHWQTFFLVWKVRQCLPLIDILSAKTPPTS